jgi:1-acyl-sn-glycerol-3-phosphate acyltransferase
LETDALSRERLQDRVNRLDIDFNAHGFDKYGVSESTLQTIAPYVASLYDHYFSVETNNISNVPSDGRVMLISNHSGGIPTDGFLISAANVFDQEPPRLVHAMVDKFMNNFPFLSPIMRKLGQMVGLPANAKSVLRDDRALLVFPEGAAGTGWFGLPYIPIPPQILPIPFPVNCMINFGEPMTFAGDGNESDRKIKENVDRVKKNVCDLLNEGLEDHKVPFFPQSEATIERWEVDHART